MKEQENSSEEEIVEMEASNSSGRGFRVMTIRIFNIMKKRHRNHKKGPVRNKECNRWNKEYTWKKKNKWLDEADDWICDLEDKVIKYAQAEQQSKNNLKNEESIRNILDNMKLNNIHIMIIPEGEESEQGIKNLFEEIMTKTFPYLLK